MAKKPPADDKQKNKSSKATFDDAKATFETSVLDMKAKNPTKHKILEIYEKTGFLHPFSRSDIMKITGVSSYSAGVLIKKMTEANLIEAVTGFGKGKYQFIPKSK